MRIFIDSRHRTVESLNSSDFTIELNENLELPRNSKIRLHDVSLPYAWRTVEDAVNDQVCVEMRPAGQASTYARLKLPAGQYDGRSLATQLGVLLNNAKPPQWPGTPFTVAYNDQLGSISITLAGSVAGIWALWPDLQVMSNPVWTGFDKTRLASFNRNMRISGDVMKYNAGETWTSQFLDLRTISDIYVHCNLSTGSIGPQRGMRSCLAKIAVSSGYGYIIVAEGGSWEYADCASTMVQRISLRLADAAGATVPLHGCDWSRCLTFNDPTSIH